MPVLCFLAREEMIGATVQTGCPHLAAIGSRKNSGETSATLCIFLRSGLNQKGNGIATNTERGRRRHQSMTMVIVTAVREKRRGGGLTMMTTMMAILSVFCFHRF